MSDPATLESMIENLRVKTSGSATKALIVMDAGIATEENLTWLKSKNRKYIVVSRRQNLVLPENKEAVIKTL